MFRGVFIVGLLLVGLLGHSALSRELPAYYPEDFKEQIYKGPSNDSAFKDSLHKILSGLHQKRPGQADLLVEVCPPERECYKQRRVLSYRSARRELFGFLHLKKDGRGFYLHDVYCNKVFGSNSGVGKYKIPRSSSVNCEHTWPQSRFSSKYPKSTQKTDLHHLFPTDTRANSVRGNYIFAEVSENTDRGVCSSSKVGVINGRRAFEPPNRHKGNVARALFYFSVRYKISISSIEEGFLRKWHLLDPVDEAERMRNDRIFQIQGNRNPFIDEPALVARVSDF